MQKRTIETDNTPWLWCVHGGRPCAGCLAGHEFWNISEMSMPVRRHVLALAWYLKPIYSKQKHTGCWFVKKAKKFCWTHCMKPKHMLFGSEHLIRLTMRCTLDKLSHKIAGFISCYNASTLYHSENGPDEYNNIKLIQNRLPKITRFNNWWYLLLLFA